MMHPSLLTDTLFSTKATPRLRHRRTGSDPIDRIKQAYLLCGNEKTSISVSAMLAGWREIVRKTPHKTQDTGMNVLAACTTQENGTKKVETGFPKNGSFTTKSNKNGIENLLWGSKNGMMIWGVSNDKPRSLSSPPYHQLIKGES